jgi:hypothetical protein
MLPLPAPIRGGKIDDLKKVLNLRGTRAWLLFVSDLLASLLARGPYPVLSLFGEAGSAKTTTTRIFRDLIDPNVAPSRGMPKSTQDLVIMAKNGWVLAFDNLSYLSAEFSDLLCRLSSGGGGYSTRSLYTNSDEVIFDGQRPILVNGIEEFATRTDLLDRSILLELKVIEKYRSEIEFWQEFEDARPSLLGALLDVAVEPLRNLPSVRLIETPRMADFAKLGTAAEAPMGAEPGAFMKAYLRNRVNANAIALETSPIADLIIDLIENSPWQGTAEKLLLKLRGFAPDEIAIRKSWPKTGKVLSGMLRRLSTALRRAGVEVSFWRDNSPRRNRMISVKRRTSTENAVKI